MDDIKNGHDGSSNSNGSSGSSTINNCSEIKYFTIIYNSKRSSEDVVVMLDAMVGC